MFEKFVSLIFLNCFKTSCVLVGKNFDNAYMTLCQEVHENKKFLKNTISGRRSLKNRLKVILLKNNFLSTDP